MPRTTYASSSDDHGVARPAVPTPGSAAAGPGSGALRDTSRASTSTPASHSRPNRRVSGTSVVKPTFGARHRTDRRGRPACRRRGRARRSGGPRGQAEERRAATGRRSGRPSRRAPRPPATARCRSGRRKPAASTSAPARVTERGITVSPAWVSARPPAFPESSTVPPTAVTTVAATTRGNAPSGRSAAPAAHSPSAATTPMATSAAEHRGQGLPQPWRATTAWSGGGRGLTLPR